MISCLTHFECSRTGTFQLILQGIHAGGFMDRGLSKFVAQSGVELRQVIGQFPVVSFGQVHFIDDNACGYVVCFAGDQETVHKAEVEFRLANRLHHPGAVNIGHQDLLAPAPVRSLAGNVVFALVDFGDGAGTVIAGVETDKITHGNGVRYLFFIEAKLARQAAVNGLTVHRNLVPLARGLYDPSFSAHGTKGTLFLNIGRMDFFVGTGGQNTRFACFSVVLIRHGCTTNCTFYLGDGAPTPPIVRTHSLKSNGE
jgi:hypothetical protein